MIRFQIPDIDQAEARAAIRDSLLKLDPDARLTFTAQGVEIDSTAGTKAVQEAIGSSGHAAIPA
jgi:hypothetical protein